MQWIHWAAFTAGVIVGCHILAHRAARRGERLAYRRGREYVRSQLLAVLPGEDVEAVLDRLQEERDAGMAFDPTKFEDGMASAIRDFRESRLW